MSMITRCPQCTTAFKLVSDQLRIRNGLVRCGVCAHVFDGLTCILDQAEVPSSAPPSIPAVIRQRADQRPFDNTTILGETRYVHDYANTAPFSASDFSALSVSHEKKDLFYGWWRWGCWLGLVSLILQFIWVYRVEVATRFPPLRPLMTKICSHWGCTIGYLRRIERIYIQSSSLQPPQNVAASEAQHTRFVLTVVMRNRYSAPQAWPLLVLELTDFSDTVVVRKLLPPSTYLPNRVTAPAFAAQAEIEIAVPIEVKNLQINGYQLSKLFP